MKKIIIYTLSFILASSLLVPMGSLNVFASEDNTVELGDGIKIVEVTEKKLQIINDKEGTTDTIEYVDEDSAIVMESNGEIHNISFDENGNAYDNGVLVSEVKVVNEVEGNINESKKPKSSISTRGVSGPWLEISTTYTTRSFHNTSISVAISIIGFVPGFGYIAGAASIAHAIWASGQREVYYKKIYFVDTSYIWHKTNVYAYRNSNHTGLLSSTYGGVTRIHW